MAADGVVIPSEPFPQEDVPWLGPGLGLGCGQAAAGCREERGRRQASQWGDVAAALLLQALQARHNAIFYKPCARCRGGGSNPLCSSAALLRALTVQGHTLPPDEHAGADARAKQQQSSGRRLHGAGLGGRRGPGPEAGLAALTLQDRR